MFSSDSFDPGEEAAMHTSHVLITYTDTYWLQYWSTYWSLNIAPWRINNMEYNIVLKPPISLLFLAIVSYQYTILAQTMYPIHMHLKIHRFTMFTLPIFSTISLKPWFAHKDQ